MAQRAFLSQLKELEDKLEKVQPVLLEKVVEHLVSSSPDDTGAYILSHSIGRSGNVGYSLSSHNRPSNPNQHKGEAYAQLMTQAKAIPPLAQSVWIGNNAPHATAVEYGGVNWGRGGYFVYSELKNILPMLLEDAKIEVGLR